MKHTQLKELVRLILTEAHTKKMLVETLPDKVDNILNATPAVAIKRKVSHNLYAKMIADYLGMKIIRELGSGADGVVYLVETSPINDKWEAIILPHDITSYALKVSTNPIERIPYKRIMHIKQKLPENIAKHLPTVYWVSDKNEIEGLPEDTHGILIEVLQKPYDRVIERMSTAPITAREGSLEFINDPQVIDSILDSLKHVVVSIAGDSNIGKDIMFGITRRLASNFEKVEANPEIILAVKDYITKTSQSFKDDKSQDAQLRLDTISILVGGIVTNVKSVIKKYLGNEKTERRIRADNILIAPIVQVFSKRIMPTHYGGKRIAKNLEIPESKSLRRAGEELSEIGIFWNDLHWKNIMMREDGTLVFSDLGRFDIE